MSKIPQISEAELEVMKIVWEMGAVTSSQVVERLTNLTDWKPKTIQTLINRLVSKEALSTEKLNGKAFIYTSRINEKEYKIHANNSFLDKLYNGSLNLMLTSFIKDQNLSKKEIEELKKLLDEEK